MKKSLLSVAIAAAVAAAASLLAPQGAVAGTSSHANKSGTDTYMVIKILDKYKVITTKQLTDEKKRTADDYKQKVKLWQDERKSDATAPKPVQPVVKTIKGNFATQQGAEEYKTKLEKEDAEKEGDKPDDKANNK